MKNEHVKRILDTFSLFNSKYKPILLIILFNALFFFSFYVLSLIWDIIFPISEQFTLFSSFGLLQFFLFIIVFLYAAVVVLIYSFFSYYIFHYIRSCFKKEKLSFHVFKKIYLSNLIIIAVLIAFYLLLSIFSYRFINQQNIGMFGIIVLFPVLFFLYPFFSYDSNWNF